MVSKFSQGFQVSRPLDPVDLNAYDNTFAYKQANYDKGYLQIASTLESMNNVDLIKPEDIEYKNKKVKALTEQINGYGNVDLSDPKTALQLSLEAASLSKDKDLMTKISNTRDARQVWSRYEKMKENPKLLPYYSEINEQDDNEKINNWLTGKTNSPGIKSPTLKVDTDKIIGDTLKTLQPTSYSRLDGLTRINGEIKTASDLYGLTSGVISNNPQVQAQLQRNAKFVYKNTDPNKIYEEGLRLKMDAINDAKESVQVYQNQLKNPNLSKEDKAILEQNIITLSGVNKDYKSGRIFDATNSYNELNNEYVKGDRSKVDQLKFQLYADSYARSVSAPYVVNKFKVTADNAAIYQDKKLNDGAREIYRTENENRNKQLDRDLKKEEQWNDAVIALAKTGMTPDRNEYERTGNIVLNSNSTGTFGQMSVVQKDNSDVDAIKELDTKIQQGQLSNKSLVSQMTIDILKDTDRDLLSQIKPLLEQGNLFDNNGKFLGESKGISKAQIDMLKLYDEALDKSADPEFIKNSPLLNKYASYQNQLVKNQLTFQSLQSEKEKVQREVFNEAWKNGETNLKWSDFQKLLRNEVVTVQKESELKEDNSFGSMLAKTAQGTSPASSNTSGLSSRFIARVNAKLNESPRKNEFYTAKYINPEDKVFNDPSSGKYSMVQDYAFKNGIIENGISKSLNGMINKEKSFRDDIPNVQKVQVDKVIPNTNQLEVTVFTKDNPDKKDLTGKKAIIQLSPVEMKNLEGRNSDNNTTPLSFNNGKMIDKKGNPLYFNLSGDIPDMIGNIQYRYYNFDDKLSMSIKIPGMTEVNIKGQEFLDERQGKEFITKLYLQTFKANQSLFPTDTPEQLSKRTLQTIYKQLN